MEKGIKVISMRKRNEASYDTLEEIIKALKSPHADMVWVSKNYSKSMLIRDLEKINKSLQSSKDESKL